MTIRWVQWFRHADVPAALATGLWARAEGRRADHHDAWAELLRWIGPGDPPGAEGALNRHAGDK